MPNRRIESRLARVESRLDQLKRAPRRAAWTENLAALDRRREQHGQASVELLRDGRFREAIEQAREAFRLDPNDHRPLLNAGVAHMHLGELQEAQVCFVGAMHLAPDKLEPLDNLGVLYTTAGQHDEAIQWHRKALAIAPDTVRTIRNLAAALEQVGRTDEALVEFERALAIDPTDNETRVGRGLSRLLLGDLAGMADLDCRLNRPRVHKHELEGVPRWDGRQLDGTLLVNQLLDGFGDAIMGIRSAVAAHKKVSQVAVLCRPAIASLMERVEGVDVVVTNPDDLPGDIEAQCAALGLPWYCDGAANGNITAEVPYLKLPFSLAGWWRCRLLDALGFNSLHMKVGVVWQGDPMNSNDARRSFQLKHLEPLAHIPGVTLISLQKGCGTDQLRGITSCVFDLNRIPEYRDGDMLETAAAMSALDLIISADTGLAHLAGAMGLPTWIALPFVPEWRWQRTREDSPWYPTARLFRQPTPGNWEWVFNRMAEMLRSL